LVLVFHSPGPLFRAPVRMMKSDVPAGRPFPAPVRVGRDALVQPFALHRTIVVVDVAGFTNPARTMAHQDAVHQALYDVLNQAFDETGVDLGSCTVEDRGDGAMILVPPDVPKALLADRLPTRLVAALRQYNAVHSSEAAMQLRVGLHAGEVRHNQHGVVSPAVNFAFRILDAAAAKQALRQSTGVLAVIASNVFYHDVIMNEPAADPESYWQIPVSVKETSAEAWLRLPDGGLRAGRDDARVVLNGPARDLFTRGDLDRLQAWLEGVPVAQLPTLVSRAAGPAARATAPAGDAWEVFTHLMDVNAGGDGFPPALAFLELLTRQVGVSLRANLNEWINEQARRLRLHRPLEAQREHAARISADSRLHLVIAVQHDGIDADRYLLSHWRQDDPDEWPPARGEILEVDLADLEYRVDELVIDAERAWAGHSGTVALEFLLPRALLHLPVHRWHKEHDSGMPRPLCVDYPIVVRSLERMRSPHWHRVWHERWRTLMDGSGGFQVYYCQPSDLSERYRLEAILSDPRWNLMVLTRPPAERPSSGRGADELTSALRAGMPALIWHFEASSNVLQEIVSWLVEGDGMGDLPARAQATRLAALQASTVPFDVNIARDLVVLWDDPRRLVVLDQPPGPQA
jgi:hypothetical protein